VARVARLRPVQRKEQQTAGSENGVAHSSQLLLIVFVFLGFARPTAAHLFTFGGTVPPPGQARRQNSNRNNRKFSHFFELFPTKAPSSSSLTPAFFPPPATHFGLLISKGRFTLAHLSCVSPKV
jgi:hypothetical protein